MNGVLPTVMSGPLAGLQIIEFAGIGPAPFACMMLADQGAHVISIHRPGAQSRAADILTRSRSTLAIDLKQPAGVSLARRLILSSHGVVEGFRPGVMERLGLGPSELLADAPRLVYGRMTGWGQTGPYAQMAGHDINYIALSGALHACGRAGDKPTPPINLLGDFGGGGMFLAFGMVCGLLHAQATGRGQVVDCAMTEGSALLMSMTWGFLAAGEWRDERGVNFLDTGAHYYNTYETRDGKFISLGAIEPQFYRELRELLALHDPAFDVHDDPAAWPTLKDKLAAIVRERTRDEWCRLLEGTDTCFAPVLSMAEAPEHPHMKARSTFVTIDGVVQPAPAPRFSGTPASQPRPPRPIGSDTDAVLAGMGLATGEIAQLRRDGIITGI